MEFLQTSLEKCVNFFDSDVENPLNYNLVKDGLGLGKKIVSNCTRLDGTVNKHLSVGNVRQHFEQTDLDHQKLVLARHKLAFPHEFFKSYHQLVQQKSMTAQHTFLSTLGDGEQKMVDLRTYERCQEFYNIYELQNMEEVKYCFI